MAAGSVLFSKRFLLIALAVCAALHVASLRARRITPAWGDVAVTATDSFKPDGWYPGEPFAHAVGVRAWGSWSGSDENTGTLAIGPFAAPHTLRFGASGHPGKPGNAWHIELVGTSERRELEHRAIGERWELIELPLPETWIGRPIRIIGVDNARDLGGWFALTEPIRGGRGDGNHAMLESFAAWSVNGLLLGVVFIAAARVLLMRGSLAAQWIPLGAGAIVATCGYVAFWLYFANALLGVVFSWSVITAALVVAAAYDRHSGKPDGDGHGPPLREAESVAEIATVVKLMLGVGAFHLALLHLFPVGHDFYTLAANRFREALPGDNMLSHGLAERLFASVPAKNPADAWRSSDRPPLQAGWQLLTWPAGKLLGLERRNVSGTSAVWFQLLWVAGACGLLRTLAVSRARAAGWIAAFAITGFFAQNTVFTWPKLAAGAFACGTFALLVLPRARAAHLDPRGDGTPGRGPILWAAFFGALGWLAHGGVAFSFLALLPWVVAGLRRGETRHWLAATAVFAALALPWVAYQKLYDPPGNQLLKLHLAGQQGHDARGTWETVRASYARLDWNEAWAHKAANFHGQVYGDWNQIAQVSAENAPERRRQEFFHTGRALTWWPVLAVLALVLTRRPLLRSSADLALLAGWLAVTIVVWCLLIFGPYNAGIHHGSYAMMIGLFVFFSVLLERAGRGWLAVIVALQAISFGTTWAVGSLVINGPAEGLPFVIATGAVLAWFIARAFARPALTAGSLHDERDVRDGEPATELNHAWTRIPTALHAWWQNPRLTRWAFFGLAVLMFLRKPHALHTPQLWAEDGSVFLNDQDALGLGAFFSPYMGYIHALPRIIAWLAAHLLDPVWWPAFYNGTAFAIWAAAIGRLFTARFDLPGKPWLALAFLLVPHSGEVFFNVTNLQWLTGFVLIQQALIRAPTTRGERIADAVILALVALTGPFVIAFLPLFAWRWWRARNRDNLLPLAIVLTGAVVQAWFVVRTGPRFPFQSEPLNIWLIFDTLARRVVVWPIFGRELALGMSPLAMRVFGALFLGGLFAWVLRPHPRRLLRAQILLAFGLIVLAGVYRTRPDTWAHDNLDFGERYFYIPRVLFAWLLVWEFDATPRVTACLARIASLAIASVHIGNYKLPAPKDYYWAAHVEPIRRGAPANIPILPENWTLEYRGRPKK